MESVGWGCVGERRGSGKEGIRPGSAGEGEGAGLVLDPFLEAAADDFAEVEDAGIGDEVDDIRAFAATADDGGLGECLEVAGGVGLGEAGELDELGDVEFLGPEGLEEAEARGFAEDAEAGGDKFDGLIGEGRVGRLRHGRKRGWIRACVKAYDHILI